MSAGQDLTGAILDHRYRITQKLAEGGMGQIYEGLHLLLNRRVAIKVLNPRFAGQENFRRRFLREARIAATIAHPNIVQIFDVGDTPDGSVYFAMEFLHGRDVWQILQREGPLLWSRVRYLLLQLTTALQAAHNQRVIHRDVKPANFFVSKDLGNEESVKVVDFGIARVLTDSSVEDDWLADRLTGTGEVFGTAKYMAPETAMGVSVDHRADIYSLGISAYEMLTGQVPFTGVNAFQILTRHISESPRPLREINPGVSEEVQAIVLRAIAKKPENRFESMDALRTAIAAIASDDRPLAAASATSSSAHVAIDPVPSTSNVTLSVIPPQATHKPVVVTEPLSQTVLATPLHPALGGNVVSSSPISDRRGTASLAGVFKRLTTLRRDTGNKDRRVQFVPHLIPEAYSQYRVALLSFLEQTFISFSIVNARLLRMGCPVSLLSSDYECYVLFMGQGAGMLNGSLKGGQMGESTFVAQMDPLEEHLNNIPQGGTRRVVVAVTAFRELGSGVRSKILDYWKKYRVTLVPLHVGEVLCAYREGTINCLLKDRLSDYHPAQDLFRISARFDPTRHYGRSFEIVHLLRLVDDPSPLFVVFCGPPKSGRSSIVSMVRYSCDPTKDMMVVDCRSVFPQNPKILWQKIHKLLAGPNLRSVQADARVAFDASSSRISPSSADREEVFAELAKVFSERNQAVLLASRAGFPRGRIPDFCAPLEFWSKIVTEADNGAVRGGSRIIIEKATELYPENNVFSSYHREPPGEKSRKENVDVPVDVEQSDDVLPSIVGVSDVLGQRRGRLILVLENIDWLIEDLQSREVIDDRRCAAQRLIVELFELCLQGKLGVMLTSVHGHCLGHSRIGDSSWSNPVTTIVQVQKVGNLEMSESSRMLRDLGVQMNMEFEDSALREVFRRSGGNAAIGRRIGSAIVETLRRDGHTGLVGARVSKRHVAAAASALVGAVSTFLPEYSDWYNDEEKRILRVLAERPRKSKRLLELSGAGLASVARLDECGVIKLDSAGRYLFATPLFGEWIRVHISLPHR